MSWWECVADFIGNCSGAQRASVVFFSHAQNLKKKNDTFKKNDTKKYDTFVLDVGILVNRHIFEGILMIEKNSAT